MKAYLIEVFGGVEPELCGPFESAEKRDEAAAEWFRHNGQYSQDALFALDINKNGEPCMWPYSGEFTEEALA